MTESFRSFDGTRLAYDVSGDGPSVVLLHGFAADAHTNWHRPGIVAALVDAGYRVITPDARGHGRSEHPRTAAAYRDGALVRDASALLDHLRLDRAHFVGYSMGAMTTARVAVAEPRVRSVVLGGVAVDIARTGAPVSRDIVADALVATDPATIEQPVALAFRRFADATGADREALAVLMRSGDSGPVDLAAITTPALVVFGAEDPLAATAPQLAQGIRGAHLRRVRGDHLTAVTDPAFAQAVVDFLDAVTGTGLPAPA